jgi:type IV pilus assembly protein PilQ
MKNLVYFVLILIMFTSGCSSPQQVPQISPVSPVPSAEADEPAPQRELVASYDSLKPKAETPKILCRVFTLKNISPQKAVETISRIIPNAIAVTNDDSRTIVIRGEENDINDAKGVIESIDKKIPQILIEGKVIEVSESGLSDLGVIWGKEQGSFKFSVDSDGKFTAANIQGTLDLLVAKGKAKVLASPRISALDGKEAEINIGSRIPYAVPAGTTSTQTQWTIQYIDAGVSLKILPQVASDGTIISTIKPEVSNISEWRTTTAGEFPVISTRNASVTVRMNDGETLAIGGLINECERENLSGIPILSDMPLVGQAFQRSVKEKTKTDVIFLITPRLMR